MRCTVCSNPHVSEVDVLLATGSSVRKVARMFPIPRTNLGRHKAHVVPGPRPFAVIDTNDGPPGPGDPLSEAILLAERARTPRERLRALEQVRAATKLSIRGRADLGNDELELLRPTSRKPKPRIATLPTSRHRPGLCRVGERHSTSGSTPPGKTSPSRFLCPRCASPMGVLPGRRGSGERSNAR